MTDKLTVKRHKRGKPYMGDDYSEFWSEVLQERDILKKKLNIALKAVNVCRSIAFQDGDIDLIFEVSDKALSDIKNVKVDKTGPKREF
jgi:hypothetical protein